MARTTTTRSKLDHPMRLNLAAPHMRLVEKAAGSLHMDVSSFLRNLIREDMGEDFAFATEKKVRSPSTKKHESRSLTLHLTKELFEHVEARAHAHSMNKTAVMAFYICVYFDILTFRCLTKRFTRK